MNVKSWEFIWWVHDDTKFSKKGEGAKVFLSMANDPATFPSSSRLSHVFPVGARRAGVIADRPE